MQTAKQEDGHYSCYDFNKHWCLYDVLVVRWREVLAERVGIGRYHVDTFGESQRGRELH